ncbi:hypothetical protein Tco_1211233 [Tanacetum coccineum]
MSFPHPIIILSDSDVEDTSSSIHSPDYFSASPDYFPASLGNTSSNFLDDLTKDLLASLALSPFYDDPYMKVMQAHDATDNELPIPPQAPIAPPTILPPSLVLSLSPITMTTANQGISVEEIKQIVAQRVANAIETIAIYETKTRMAQESTSQTKQQEKKVAGNASNKRK